MSVKFPFLGGFWGGGSADFIFMGARIFLSTQLAMLRYQKPHSAQ